MKASYYRKPRRRSGPTASTSDLVSGTFAPTANGIATAALTYTARTAAAVGLASRSVTYDFYYTTVGALSTVTASPESIADTGLAASTITITLLDATGQPLVGVPSASVVVAVSGSGNTVTQPTAPTNSAGVTTASFTSLGAGEKVVSVTACGALLADTASVTVTGEEESGDASSLFASDWSTATGQSEAALGDGGTWSAIYGFPENTALTLNVVTSASTPAAFSRTSNVLRITQRGALYNGTLEQTDVIPLNGDSYGQLFVMNSGDTSTHNHPLTYNLIGGFQTIPLGLTGDATDWFPFVRFANGSYPRIQFSPGVQGVGGVSRLAHDTWFRYRWRVQILTPGNGGTYRIYPQVYSYNNAAPTSLGTLLFDASTFFVQDYAGGAGGSLQAYYDGGGTFTIEDAELARNIALGQEGAAGAPDTGNHWYVADFRVWSNGWEN